MPCWSTISMNVDLSKLKNHDRLKEAAEDLGWRVSQQANALLLFKDGITIRISGNNAMVTGPQGMDVTKIVNELKGEYTVKTVTAAAKRFGWTQQKTTNKRKVTLMR